MVVPNLLINAGPGCGKTHTIVDAYLYYRTQNPTMWKERFPCTEEQIAIYEWCREHFPLSRSQERNVPAIYLAYNVPIKEDLEKKIHKDAEARTAHGWGYKVLNTHFGYIKLNWLRDQAIVSKITGQDFNSLKNKNSWYKAIRYMEKIKEELLPISMESLYYLNQKYDNLIKLTPSEEMIDQLTKMKDAMRTVDRQVGITYIDQIWLALGLLKNPIYEIGFIDECQDLSPARLQLCLKLCKNLVFCGDPNQAINAFSGADPYAFDKIREVCSHELPLKMSFRLPPNHAEAANRLKPGARLRTLPQKKEGGNFQCSLSELAEKIRPIIHKKPLVLCRYDAPLVKATLTLLKTNIPCRSLGDSLVGELIRIFKATRSTSMEDLTRKLDIHLASIAGKGSEAAQEQAEDKIQCLIYVAEQCTRLSEIEPVLKSMIKQSKEDHVLLSTIHKAKGLETSELFLLFPPIQSKRASTTEQILQEENVEFVARTRSSNNITEIFK